MLINTLQSQLKSSTLNVLYVKTIFNITSLQSAIFESVLKCVLKNIVFKVHFKWPFILIIYLKIQYFKIYFSKLKYTKSTHSIQGSTPLIYKASSLPSAGNPNICICAVQKPLPFHSIIQ